MPESVTEISAKHFVDLGLHVYIGTGGRIFDAVVQEVEYGFTEPSGIVRESADSHPSAAEYPIFFSTAAPLDLQDTAKQGSFSDPPILF